MNYSVFLVVVVLPVFVTLLLLAGWPWQRRWARFASPIVVLVAAVVITVALPVHEMGVALTALPVVVALARLGWVVWSAWAHPSRAELHDDRGGARAT